MSRPYPVGEMVFSLAGLASLYIIIINMLAGLVS